VIRLDYLPLGWKTRRTDHYVPAYALAAGGRLDWLDEAGLRADTGLACDRGQLRFEGGGGEPLFEATFEPSNDSLTLVAIIGAVVIARSPKGFALVVGEHPPHLIVRDLADGREVACGALGTWAATEAQNSGPELVFCDSSHSFAAAGIRIAVTPRARISGLAERAHASASVT